MNTQRCHYVVQYGRKTARFSDAGHALRYGRYVAVTDDTYAEVYAPDGIIAQFREGTGEATPEFAHLNDQLAA